MTLKIDKLNITEQNRRPLLIAGPCSAESEEQVINTATELHRNGVRIFRAGIWKPRTKPGCFEGHGIHAIPWIKAVKAETGMITATEVATPEHVETALKAGIDIFWIGARTTTNPFAVQAIADSLAGTDIPILVKNPINPDLELWVGAIERLWRAGIRQIGAIHRGFSSYNEKQYRYQPMWQIPIELRRRIPEMTLICDPSHMGGKREYIHPLSQQAMDLGMDGLMIECHNNPDEAWSDAKQQITPDILKDILTKLIIRNETEQTENISILRKQIDDIDSQLLDIIAKRMAVCRDIGQYKRDHDMTVVHTSRYSEIIEKSEMLGKSLGVDPICVKNIFELLHQESVRQQIDIINKK